MTTDRDTTVRRIARQALDIETLEIRNSDRLDFHDRAVWTIKDALERAYEAGRAAVPPPPPITCPCPACGREVTITPVNPITPT